MIFVTKKNIYFLLLLCLGLCTSNALHAQKLKKLIASGDSYFAANDYFIAAQYYNLAILKDSSDISLQYKYAEASRLNYDLDIALYWYNKILKQDKQGKLYPECIFWVASLKKIKGNYKEAKALFNKYAQKNKKNKNSYYVKKAMQEVAACDYAQMMVNNPDKTIAIIHLDSNVNSKVSEYAPLQVDSILYFSSLRDAANRDEKNNINYNKIYTSTEQKNTWKKLAELDSSYNKQAIHNANTAFNSNRTKIYITRCLQKSASNYTCEIYSSELINNEWTEFKKLPPEINTEGYNTTNPATGYMDGQEVLFFASDRPGGEGAMDIWYSKVNADGTFEKPVNAGKKVNSIEDEITPFYCIPCEELFFSSTWHKGLGGFDIFKSNYQNKTFSEPKNLGVPINSSYNDIYFSISTKKTKAFLSSNRPGSFFEEKESCCNDIYMFKIPGTTEPDTIKKTDSTQLFTTQLKLLVPLSLYFHNDEPDRKTLATTTKKNYQSVWQDYMAMKATYKQEFSKGVKAKDINRAKEDIDILFDDSIDGGMKNLEEFARVLVKLLKQGEKITITMKGYSSPLASTTYNANLSKRRISSLKNYFMEYENGVLLPYINNTDANKGTIIFIEEEMGELKAKANVSDNYYDVKNSVYSPLAAYERKIQIIAVSFGTNQ